MASLYFYYSAMNAGKLTSLLQSSYNYKERGMNPILFTAEIDSRSSYGCINSRIGLSYKANLFNSKTNLFNFVKNINNKNVVHCVLVDECHFLTKRQVFLLTRIVDELNIPVLCYGLRTDFQAKPFIGSLWLLSWADKLIELKTVCFCGKKSNRVVRINEKKDVVKSGKKIMIGGNNNYISLCRKHFNESWNLNSLKFFKS